MRLELKGGVNVHEVNAAVGEFAELFEVVTAIDDAGVEMGGGAAGGQGLVAEDLAGLGWRVGGGLLGHASGKVEEKGATGKAEV